MLYTKMPGNDDASYTKEAHVTTILVADDEPDVLDYVSTVLDMRGFQVLVAANGEDALRQANQYRGAIDLLLSDVVLPDISGPDIAKDLVSIRPNLKVVFMSGFTDHAIVRQGLLDPGVHFIHYYVSRGRFLNAALLRYSAEADPGTPREN